MSRALIVSDGRPGHLNQSLALTKYLGITADVHEVSPRFRWSKALSYILDKAGIYTDRLFTGQVRASVKYDLVIGAGSSTYYMTKVMAKELGAKSVTMMLPHGYHYDFDLIFAQKHDKPPVHPNILEVPANFAYVEPHGIYQASKRSIGIVIGGDNKVFSMSEKLLQEQLNAIIAHYDDYEVAVTTSPRTPESVVSMLKKYTFDYSVIYSEDPVNPIPDFLDQCETVFITSDSTSMISEAVSYGSANVIVLPLESDRESKFTRLVDTLEKEGYLSVYDGTFKEVNRKIDFSKYAKRVML